MSKVIQPASLRKAGPLDRIIKDLSSSRESLPSASAWVRGVTTGFTMSVLFRCVGTVSYFICMADAGDGSAPHYEVAETDFIIALITKIGEVTKIFLIVWISTE